MSAQTSDGAEPDHDSSARAGTTLGDGAVSDGPTVSGASPVNGRAGSTEPRAEPTVAPETGRDAEDDGHGGNHASAFAKAEADGARTKSESAGSSIAPETGRDAEDYGRDGNHASGFTTAEANGARTKSEPAGPSAAPEPGRDAEDDGRDGNHASAFTTAQANGARATSEPAGSSADSTPRDGETSRILSDLSRSTEQAPALWRDHIFDATSRWHLPAEVVSDDDEYVYLVGGEAFNWRRLAERLAWHIELLLPDKLAAELRAWVEADHIFGGIDESDFRRILGSDKWRAYLNYFYGITLERCLLVYAGNRIGKLEFSRGRQVSDDCLDDAYVALYDATEPELWARFVAETDAEEAGASHSDETRSTAQDDEFTYWLFKRRIASTYQVNVAHEVKHGLELFDKVGSADERRRKMLAHDDISALLEFKLAKHTGRRPRPARSRKTVPATKGG